MAPLKKSAGDKNKKKAASSKVVQKTRKKKTAGAASKKETVGEGANSEEASNSGQAVAKIESPATPSEYNPDQFAEAMALAPGFSQVSEEDSLPAPGRDTVETDEVRHPDSCSFPDHSSPHFPSPKSLPPSPSLSLRTTRRTYWKPS